MSSLNYPRGGYSDKFCRGSAARKIIPYPYASANGLKITPYESAQFPQNIQPSVHSLSEKAEFCRKR